LFKIRAQEYHLGRAAAVAEARGPDAAWALLEAIPAESILTYQRCWACAAHVLNTLGRRMESRSAAERAVGLSSDSAVRDFLVERFLQA
jgi:predicted RNA polymerase sigma factor